MASDALPCLFAMQGAPQGRNGAVYTTLVEVVCGAAAAGFTRGSSKVVLTYYVNGTMIDVYKMVALLVEVVQKMPPLAAPEPPIV